jgi:hypothetical protein
MGKIRGPYEAEYPAGTFVVTADRAVLEQFLADWQYHNKPQPEQLLFAGQRARVSSVSFYHGSDEIYTLDGIPGVWHEQCLRAAEE